MNIAEIAKLAGVSNAAVSRYFNNGYISKEKKEAIRQVVEATGYRPSPQAQTLRTRKTKTIGVIAPMMASFSIGSVVDGIQSVLDRNGYRMLLSVTQNEASREIEYLKAFAHNQVDGIILLASILTDEHLKQIRSLKIPIIINGQKAENCVSVYYDDYHAMYDMTISILRQGRRKLGYIGVLNEDEAVGARRLKGFRNAVMDYGMEELSENTLIGSFHEESGKEKAIEMLDKVPDLDGLICAADTLAVGAAYALSRAGIQVPEQVIVTGQGDSVMTRMAGYRIPTIHYPYRQSGEITATMLLRRLEQDEDRLEDIRLGYFLVNLEEE